MVAPKTVGLFMCRDSERRDGKNKNDSPEKPQTCLCYGITGRSSRKTKNVNPKKQGVEPIPITSTAWHNCLARMSKLARLDGIIVSEERHNYID